MKSVGQKSVLITGGCGFVGRHLVKQMIAEGARVTIIDNLSTGKHPNQWATPSWREQLEFIHSDAIPFFTQSLMGSDAPHESPVRYDEVYHLASVVGGRAVIEGDPMAVAIDLAIDSLFFRWVVANKSSIGRVLYASSSAAYPVHLQGETGAVALQESYISFDERMGMPDMTYGWSKLTGEYLSQIVARQYGIPVACVRPFSGYGGDQDQSYPIPAIARRAARRENPLVVWGTGQQGRDFVHIDDCVVAMRMAIAMIKDGSAVNIGSGKLTTFIEVAGLLAELAGYQPEIKPLVDRPTGVKTRYSDTSEMKRRLRWQPRISLREGLERVLHEQQTDLEQSVLAVSHQSTK